ncbi:MAG: phosphatidylglycerophosphatase A [Alphaproteobacteria bacterium]|nr:MAG: phosphatidylglycerophosphatase A [Alphaproteobacteria bacterium]
MTSKTPPSETRRSPSGPPGTLPWPGAWRDPAFWIATGCGSGLLPKAPGTWGTLVALALGWCLHGAGGPLAMGLAAVGALLIGVWASERYMRRTATHDPGAIVIDEFAGQWLALVAMPAGGGPVHWAAAFILFRIFDILKPWPIGVLDRRIKGGWGVMLDDIAAGAYAALVLWGGSHVFGS